VPLAARWVAERLPTGIESRMGEQMLTALDRHYLAPSRLDSQWREGLARRFAEAATKAAPGVPYRLEFRAMGEGSINAFALPGGIVVMLDGLVEFAGTRTECWRTWPRAGPRGAPAFDPSDASVGRRWHARRAAVG